MMLLKIALICLMMLLGLDDWVGCWVGLDVGLDVGLGWMIQFINCEKGF